MMDFTKIKASLEKNGYSVKVFASSAEARDYLDGEIDGQTVGIGGSVTVEQLGLYDALSKHNEVFWHWRPKDGNEREKAKNAGVYISSVNGISENGEIVNIDGTGNRVASVTYGHEKVYLVAGQNKIVPDLGAAIFRARNVAAPLNAKRLGVKTPCAVNGDKCYDCSSPSRICKSLSVLWRAPGGCRYEVVLVEEDLGY